MTSQESFKELLIKFAKRDGRGVRQLVRAGEELFGEGNGIPHNTLARWLRPNTNNKSKKKLKPRSWEYIVKISCVLRLTESEANRLLLSAEHPPVHKLKQQIQQEDNQNSQALWHIWENTYSKARIKIAPFQADPDLTTFVGRKTELCELRKALQSDPPENFVCIQGMGGAGKTSLALHVAYRLRDHFPDGVLWANLAKSNPANVLQTFVEAYDENVARFNDIQTKSRKFRELMANKQALMVLDDVINDDDARPLLPPSGKCAVLITTRRHDLSIADHGIRIQLGTFVDGKESLTLFKRVLGRAQVELHGKILLKIADMLGHLPLAIDIAARRIKEEHHLSAHGFLERLQIQQIRLDQLERGDRQIKASFNISFDALKKQHQELFSSLWVFAQDFSESAVADIMRITRMVAGDILGYFYNLSLIQPSQNGRYKLHPLIRDYSREQCQSPDKIQKRMVLYFVSFFVENKGHPQWQTPELGNMQNALQVASENGWDDIFMKGVIAISPLLRSKGLYDEARLCLEKSQHIARDIGNLDDLVLLLTELGQVSVKQGEVYFAESIYQEALALTRHNNMESISADILSKLGALSYRFGRYDEAEKRYDNALLWAKQKSDLEMIVTILTNKGLLAVAQGNYKVGGTFYNEALPIAHELENKRLLITVLQNYGSLLEEMGNYGEAHDLYVEGLQLAEKLGEPIHISRMLGNLGTVACGLQHIEEAIRLFSRGVSLAEKYGMTIQAYRHSANLGYAKAQDPKRYPQKAINLHYMEALESVRQVEMPYDLCDILIQWGEYKLVQNETDKATSLLDEALQLAELHSLRIAQARALFGLASIAETRSNIEKACEQGIRSYEIFREANHRKKREVYSWLIRLPCPNMNMET